VPASERPPADLEGTESLVAILRDDILHLRRLLHEQRAIRLRTAAIGAADEPPDRLAERLARDVPERDVDAADRMGQRAAAPHPECMLIELFADPLGFERILAAIKRLEN